MLNDDVIGTVSRANVLIKNIADLNEEIVKVKALGDNPNDLMDRRDLLVNELSSLIDITISEKDPDEYSVYTGGMHIIQGRNYNLFETVFNPNNEGYADVVWEGTDNLVGFRGGQLFALLELRDGDVRSEIQKLDLMTINFVDLVNEVHTNAYNLSGETGIRFFNELPFVINNIGNYDRNGDGAFDSTYIFRIAGTNRLNGKDQIGLRGFLTLPGLVDNVAVEYYPTDTVDDIINRINNSGAEVAAFLNRDGMLSIKGIPSADTDNPDFVIRHIEDSGQFLVGYAGLLDNTGPAGAFDWAQADQINRFASENFTVAPLPHPSSWIEINDELLKDPNKIAASFQSGGGSPGDGAAALTIAQLRTKPVTVGDSLSFDDYFATIVADIGAKGEQSEIELKTIEQVLLDLNALKQSIAGVNIDEELANVIKFQHGYNAAARFISEVDKMLDVIINRMGV
jgi:flagellar hook-associated protein 1 FlgK